VWPTSWLEIAPFLVMCDAADIGVTVDAGCLGQDALFLYDKYPGGIGYARRCLDRLPELLDAARSVIEDCPCDDGCPSCVGAAMPAYAQSDMDSSTRGRILDKAASGYLLKLLLGAEDRTQRRSRIRLRRNPQDELPIRSAAMHRISCVLVAAMLGAAASTAPLAQLSPAAPGRVESVTVPGMRHPSRADGSPRGRNQRGCRWGDLAQGSSSCARTVACTIA